MISFTVPGTPVPQGSKVAGITKNNKPYLRDANAGKLRPWRNAVTHAAARAYPIRSASTRIMGPVKVMVAFYLPKPQRPKFEQHAVKPDVDKLARSVLDGLTDAGVIEDDARVVRLIAFKLYSNTPRAEITVTPYEEGDTNAS